MLYTLHFALPHAETVAAANRVWNKGDGQVKLICMAPKLGTAGTSVNTGPTVGVNTSDRNSTVDDALEAISRSKSDVLRRGQSNGRQSQGSPLVDDRHEGVHGGNGEQESDGSTSSQLQTEIGSLHLTAPGTSRNDKTQEDEGSIDDVAKAQQQERFRR